MAALQDAGQIPVTDDNAECSDLASWLEGRDGVQRELDNGRRVALGVLIRLGTSPWADLFSGWCGRVRDRASMVYVFGIRYAS